MRRNLVGVAAAVAGLCLPVSGHACGDKLVVLGRGVRFERIHKAVNPGVVLVYLNPESNLPRADEEFHLSASLELAGHTVQTVGGAGELERAWRSGEPNVILADLPDAVALWEKLGGEDSAPGVVPVLYKPTPEDVARAQQVTRCVGQAARRKARTLLAVVDEMVGQHKKGEPANCAPAARKGAS